MGRGVLYPCKMKNPEYDPRERYLPFEEFSGEGKCNAHVESETEFFEFCSEGKGKGERSEIIDFFSARKRLSDKRQRG